MKSGEKTPVVLIATHNRPQITAANIRSLYNQSKAMPTVVLVYTNVREYDYFRTKFINLHLVYCSNYPLGLKWQTGVDYCRKLGADPLIILGSDDFLSKYSIYHGCEMMRYHDFIGLSSWSMYDIKQNNHFILRYNKNKLFKNFTLGAGRFYSKELLDRFEWKLFDKLLDRNLDNQGHNMTVEHAQTPIIVNQFNAERPWIMSVKGDWYCMNDTYKLLTSDQIDASHDENMRKIIMNQFDLRLENL